MLQDSSKEEEIPEVVDNAVTPLVWASEVPGRSKLAEPVKVTLKPGAKPVRQNQYPIKWEARKGLEELITKSLEYGLLVECESEYNTPILPVKKSGGKEYRLGRKSDSSRYTPSSGQSIHFTDLFEGGT
ncbi:protein NYNRIN-like [Grus japonensis]|uniref:Protein NYNRIN-like n=1 Tax=Grus japonensis TaxID=30415 RepID=A0ABC9YFT9_GRUJA